MRGAEPQTIDPEELHASIVHSAGAGAIQAAAIVKTLEEQISPIGGAIAAAGGVVAASNEKLAAAISAQPAPVFAPVIEPTPITFAPQIAAPVVNNTLSVPVDAIKLEVSQAAEPAHTVTHKKLTGKKYDGEGRLEEWTETADKQ